MTIPLISESILDDGQTLNWHVVYTRHQHEKTVNRLLEDKGIETLLPLRSTASQWKDRTKLIELPLFPCYVFFRARSESWLDVLKTPGVHMMVPGCNGPAIVPPAEIETVRRLTAMCKSVEPYPFLRHGDRVRVKSGALAGVEGFLVRRKNFNRLVVTVEILGKSAATEIDALSVERVSNSIADRLAAGQTTQQLSQPSVNQADQGRQTQMRSRQAHGA